MPGEVDRLARHPTSFYGFRNSTNGYCSRQTNIRLRSGVNGRRNGGNLRSNGVTSLSSNKVPVGVQKHAPEPPPRHCRYFNMQVRHHFPRQQFASSTTSSVRGRNLSCTNTGSATGTAHQSNGSALKTLLMEKALVKSRESRVLISAELKNKADNEMKNRFARARKSKIKDSDRDPCRSRSGNSPKKVQKSNVVNKCNGSLPEKSCDKGGLQLRNGRSLPECSKIRPEKSVISIAGKQSSNNEHAAKIKKRILQRSRSLSPTKSLALSRPRRSAVIIRKSVCCRSFIILKLHYFTLNSRSVVVSAWFAILCAL